MWCRKVGRAVAVAVILGVLLPTGPAGAQAPAGPAEPVTTPERCVPLAGLGVGAVVATHVTRTAVLKQFSLTLPPTAVQGQPDWYLIRFHVRVTAPAGARGTALVIADTSGRTAARVQFDLSPREITWSAVSLTEPARRERTVDRTVEVRMENYLQNEGVHGGVNSAAFRVELSGGARLDEVRILPDTCFVRTALTPETLRVETQTQPSKVRAGDRVTVRVRVSNTGTRPVGVLTVSARPGDPSLAPASAGTLTTTGLSGRWTGSFTFTATRTGRHVVDLDVGTAVQPLFDVERAAFEVSPPDPGGVPWWAVAGGILLIAGAVLWWLLAPVAPR